MNTAKLISDATGAGEKANKKASNELDKDGTPWTPPGKIVHQK